ncbi:MAG: HAMP domain-containing histidine kinase [Flavobacteriaceae bacterium]|jgi:sensor histidine kinase YesM|nr:HAMP domain-containing histidine kinase [Flavobacteriaceae bacterium]
MKTRSFLSRINIWFIYVLFTAIVAAATLYSFFLIQELRNREAKRIEVFAKAMKIQQTNRQIHSDTQDLILTILKENDQLPVILTDKNKKPLLWEGSFRNIPDEIIKNPEKLENFIAKMESNYEPFEIEIAQGEKQLVFYDNSQLLNNLRYFPYYLAAFILLYLWFSIWFMRTIKKTDEGFLWAGLAKETAHQIGTPLSSMIGWIEIMKMENPELAGVHEIEKDITRLKTISERFSKIGSVSELNDFDINETIRQNFDYLKPRISTKVNFTLKLPNKKILIPHNKILMSWVIENLVKNAVDAMKGMGNLEISLYERHKNTIIDFKDTGCGMTKKQALNAFKPGYSTKKRGWGLGLSLAKRVIKEYHSGDIRIAQTEVSKGSIFRIVMRAT